MGGAWISIVFATKCKKQCRSHRDIFSLENILSEWVQGHGLQPASLDQLMEALDSEIVEQPLASNLISKFLKEIPPPLPEYSHLNELAAQSDSTKLVGGISASFTGISSKQDSSRESMKYNVTFTILNLNYAHNL